MGEVVVSSEDGMELELQETEVGTGDEQISQKKSSTEGGGNAAAAGASSSSVVGWERFLPKMAVRVLLVEADDSTRHIIAALLRKCSYRVTSVSDGLKAWEVLKERSRNIDLILTEVKLPSISGYALLTLIMEHHRCKNIPVIMMSAHNSVSTVYKCMLRGAADFLVKPVRKNELRNLWQHVWRKQAANSAAGPGPPDESVAQQKVEATAENNAISNDHSSGYRACVQRNRESIEKEIDAQSSCTKPELEAEGADMEHARFPSQQKNGKCLSNDMNVRMGPNDDRTGEAEANIDRDHAKTRGQDKMSDDHSSENNQIRGNSSTEAIDLIGAFRNYSKGDFGCYASNSSTNKFDILPVLDLSLRRSNPSGSVNQVNDENQRLNHSDASAFSRYKNKPLQPSYSKSPSTCNNNQQQKGQEANSEKQQSNHIPEYNSDTHGPTMTYQKHVSVANIQSGQPEITSSYSLQRHTSLPIPVKGVRFDNAINSYGSVMPSLYCPQTSPAPLPSPGSAHHTEPLIPHLGSFYSLDRQSLISKQFQNHMDQRMSNAFDQIDNRQGRKLENLDHRGHSYPENDQIGNNSFCNGNISQHYNKCSGKNSDINLTSVVKGTSECGIEEAVHVYEGASYRSVEREAALTKFRMKRKDRCFEKKVRYESRKKLAEQRPRVKGQFVRQPLVDPQSENT
ncbi:two-component response regulator-like APRR5 isoform X2 [Primulina eburnea]|uniref:two-component response regulator-like APRR5 isoform X2 n=1 Tax=Primulina eburnea TaxID=1245227 RepID=UPI003C6BFF1D